MCRNHSHLTLKWAEQALTAHGERISICVEQPLTLDYPDGRKIMLDAGAVLSIPSLQFMDLLRSVRLPTGVPLDCTSRPMAVAYACMDIVQET